MRYKRNSTELKAQRWEMPDAQIPDHMGASPVTSAVRTQLPTPKWAPRQSGRGSLRGPSDTGAPCTPGPSMLSWTSTQLFQQDSVRWALIIVSSPPLPFPPSLPPSLPPFLPPSLPSFFPPIPEKEKRIKYLNHTGSKWRTQVQTYVCLSPNLRAGDKSFWAPSPGPEGAANTGNS